MNEHSFINYFFEIILMKKNNGISDSDLNTLDMKNIFNGFNCWDKIYLSCFIILIRYDGARQKIHSLMDL